MNHIRSPNDVSYSCDIRISKGDEHMNYSEFESEIMSVITEKLPEKTNIAVRPINKNNGVILHGLIINDGKTNISPTIYLDYYFEKIDKGSSVEDLANQVLSQYNKFSLDEDFDISVFTDYEKCKKHISYKLINYEKNKEMLEDVPHIVYLDLAIVFYCLLNNNQLESSSILIRNNHLELWGVATDDLYAVASINTPILLPAEINNLNDIVRELLEHKDDIMPYDEAENVLENPLNTTAPMYVLTNNIKLYGACCILYKNLLFDFANRVDADLWIIPSSTHESLLIPATEDYDKTYLTELVKEVNITQLEAEDILSDHVYFYSRKENAVTY